MARDLSIKALYFGNANEARAAAAIAPKGVTPSVIVLAFDNWQLQELFVFGIGTINFHYLSFCFAKSGSRR